jgi:hypothetical protein
VSIIHGMTGKYGPIWREGGNLGRNEIYKKKLNKGTMFEIKIEENLE